MSALGSSETDRTVYSSDRLVRRLPSLSFGVQVQPTTAFEYTQMSDEEEAVLTDYQ